MNPIPSASPRLLHMTTVPQTLSFLVGQVENANRHGFDVHALSSPDAPLAEFGAAQIEVHELPMARRITPLRDLLALWRLRRILRQLRPHIVHGHTPKGGLLAMIGAWWCGVPVRIYHIHGLPMVTATGLKRLLFALVRENILPAGEPGLLRERIGARRRRGGGIVPSGKNQSAAQRHHRRH